MPTVPADSLLCLIDPAAQHPEIARVMRALHAIVDESDPATGRIEVGSGAVAEFLDRHRLWTLIPIERVAGADRDLVRRRQVAAAAAQARIRSVAVGCLEALSDAGIESRVLKGLATADLDYPDRRFRHTGDVDLAVSPGDLEHACGVLRRHGCRDHPTPFDPVLLYGWTLDSSEGVEIDLHTRLFRRSPLGVNLASGPGERLSSLPGWALPAEQRLVHAAGHFIISPPGARRMSGFLDVTRLMNRAELDLDRARAFARLLGVEALVGAGLGVEAQLGDRQEVLAELSRWAQPDWLDRRTRLVSRRHLLLDHLGRYREVPAGRRLEYLPAWLFPTTRQWSILWRGTADWCSRRWSTRRRQ